MNDVYSAAPVSSARLWYGTTAAMAAWAVHGLASFVISDAACITGRIAMLKTILIALTLAALIVAISGGAVAWSTWRTLGGDSEAPGRGAFLSLTGVFISVIFTIGILWGGLAPILTGLCEATR